MVTENYYIWISIVACIVLAGTFSGLNLCLFGLGRMRLESEAGTGNKAAQNVLELRKDSNLLLSTILWANVSANTLLALLSESVMNVVMAFCFTTFLLTLFGEIFPQAFFSRHALLVGSLLTPFVKAVRFLFYPIAKPTALLLDKMVGPEGMDYFSEETLKVLLKKHVQSSDSEIEKLEGIGALNFLEMDDLNVTQEGEKIHPESIYKLAVNLGMPEFPEVDSPGFEEFVCKLSRCPKKWAIFVNDDDWPVMVMNTNAFIKAFHSKRLQSPYQYCHHPIIIKEETQKLADIVLKLRVEAEHSEDDVIDKDIILLWSLRERKIITGSDILGRLMRGIVTQQMKNRDRIR